MGILSVLSVLFFCLSVVFEREQKGSLYLSDLDFGEGEGVWNSGTSGWGDWDGIGCLMMNSFSLFILH